MYIHVNKDEQTIIQTIEHRISLLTLGRYKISCLMRKGKPFSYTQDQQRIFVKTVMETNFKIFIVIVLVVLPTVIEPSVNPFVIFS